MKKALTIANRKFEDRFRRMEATAGGAGERFADLGIEALEARWQAAKGGN